jgi:hypothetical protein
MTSETGRAEKKNWVESVTKWIVIVVSLGGFVWGIATFLITNRVQAETRLLEARKPFFDYQIQLYKEAVQVTQVIATTIDPIEKEKKTKRFWELYWGELGLVENGGIEPQDGGVEGAMVAFGTCLNDKACSNLPNCSLALAHACRNSLAASYGVNDWQAPVYQKAVRK